MCRDEQMMLSGSQQRLLGRGEESSGRRCETHKVWEHRRRNETAGEAGDS